MKKSSNVEVGITSRHLILYLVLTLVYNIKLVHGGIQSFDDFCNLQKDHRISHFVKNK